MFIKEIELFNYRIYYDVNSLCFTKDERKNLYIVSGNNGYGKTTLLTSLIWCLYGKYMSEVDDSFKKDVADAGGYKKYALNNLNRYAKTLGVTDYSVTLTLSDIYIPSIPCQEVRIKRSFNTYKLDESLLIHIDGLENELTREVGPQVFISDFILPKEIAKFFFFDAEKIVSLAEYKTVNDKRNLSKAYSEILGIKKYEDLRENLKDLRIRFRRSVASDFDKTQYELLFNSVRQLETDLDRKRNEIASLQEEKLAKRRTSEVLQEKLIREGNSITLEGIQSLYETREKLSREANEIRSKLKDLIEYAPFAIVSHKMAEIAAQIRKEKSSAYRTIDSRVLRDKLRKINRLITKETSQLRLGSKDKKSYLQRLRAIIEDSLLNDLDSSDIKIKMLHDMSDEEANEFYAIYDNIKLSFATTFQAIVREYKNNRFTFTKTIRKISDAESKEDDPLVINIRNEKIDVDKRIDTIDNIIIDLTHEIGGIQNEVANKMKTISELGKKINLEKTDKIKDQVAGRIIEKLDLFIEKLKISKRLSLSNRIKNELNVLMHKEDFITDVKIEITHDMMDISLFNKRNEEIQKETLSKGEQQLYATALLKALVDESNIKFPVFIDSPLQKFDKEHSKNIICEFYPNISEQVVLFPLLEKELTLDEYTALLSLVNQSFIIRNVNQDSSIFNEVAPEMLLIQAEKGSMYV